jgi:N-methylhydantoinase B
VVSFRVAGGGGYGNPRDREKHRILDDLRNGYVSRSAAMSLYGLKETDGLQPIIGREP